MDFPTTGAWGQTNAQREDGKTAYEVILSQRNRMRDLVNRWEQVGEETQAFVDAIEKYATVMIKDLTEDEVTILRSLWRHYSKRRNFQSIRLNDARNDLKKIETDLYNFKQRR